MSIPRVLTREDRKNKFIKNLFRDIPRTVDVILSLQQASSLDSNSRNRREEIYRAVRKAVLKLSQNEYREFIFYYFEEIFQKKHDVMDYVFFGSPQYAFDRSKEIMSFLLDALDAQPLSLDDPHGRVYTMSIIHRLAFAAYGDTFTWWNLVESAKNGDQESKKLLFDWFLRILESVEGYDVVENTTQRGHLSGYLQQNLITRGIFPYYPEHKDFTFAHIAECNHSVLEDQKELIKLLKWFHENLADFEHDAAQMWQIMIEQGAWALRPGGFDKVSVAIEAFQALGITDFQFYPEGLEFPQVKVRFWYARRVPFACDIEVSDEQLCLYRNYEAVQDGDLRALMDALRKFIALECMFEVVMRHKPPRYQRRQQQVCSSTPRRPRQQPARPTIVRARFRNLPDGHTMSEQAKENALDPQKGLGYLPPEGKTFVKEHVRGAQSPEELHAAMQQVKPLFTYTDDDLGYQGDQ